VSLYQTVEAAAKRLQLAQELIPNLRSVGLLFDHSDSGARPEAEGLVSSARRIGVRMRTFEVGTLAELENTFTKLRKERVDALLVNPNLVIFQNRDTLVTLASAIRIPVITEIQEFAEAGGVITFGPDVPSSSRRGAYFVDRILKGAKSAELPIEQPTKFNLVVNVRAAKALGLTVPESMLNRATAVIK